MTPPPVPVGLFVCDRVIVDRDNGDPSLIGIITGIVADEFPWPVRLDVYACLTNGRGRATARLTITSMASGATAEREYPLDFADPITALNVTLHLGRVRFPGPGFYEFVLKVDGELIGTRRIRVRER